MARITSALRLKALPEHRMALITSDCGATQVVILCNAVLMAMHSYPMDKGPFTAFQHLAEYAFILIYVLEVLIKRLTAAQSLWTFPTAAVSEHVFDTGPHQDPRARGQAILRRALPRARLLHRRLLGRLALLPGSRRRLRGADGPVSRGLQLQSLWRIPAAAVG